MERNGWGAHGWSNNSLFLNYWIDFNGFFEFQKVDLAIADLTITDERRAVVDFTAPFMITGISIIYKKSGVLPFNNVEELFKLNGTVPYGAMLEGSTIKFFRESKNPMYKHMYEWMTENIDNMMMSYSDALDRVSEGNFAFFMESPLVDYYRGKHCDLVRVGGLLDQKTYAFAGQKNSPYISPLNEAIVELVNSGKLHELYRKW
jgi:glutamine transport system substrate-binding protein